MIGKRFTFQAIVQGVSEDNQHICLVDVMFEEDAELFRDHIWLKYCRKWKKLELLQGNVVRFSAKVNFYQKYDDRQLDLTNIIEIERIEDEY